MSERLDFNACWDECIKKIHLPSGAIATNKYEIKEFAEAFFNLGSNYKNRDKEIGQLKAQIQKMRYWKNCTHEVDSDGCEQAGNLDGSCPCDKWEMMKLIK